MRSIFNLFSLSPPYVQPNHHIINAGNDVLQNADMLGLHISLGCSLWFLLVQFRIYDTVVIAWLSLGTKITWSFPKLNNVLGPAVLGLLMLKCNPEQWSMAWQLFRLAVTQLPLI